MQIRKESRSEKRRSPGKRDTRRGFFRAANCGGGTLGARRYERCRCATFVCASQIFVIGTGTFQTCRTCFPAISAPASHILVS
jgi:hypothetical protein